MAMMMENIIEKYETSFGKVIVISTDNLYRVGEQISTEEGTFLIKQIIMPTTPSEIPKCSFVVI